MNEPKKQRIPLLSHRFTCRLKTYFFDVYENDYGGHFLKLTQSIRDKNASQEQPNFFRDTIHINEESIDEFFQYFTNAMKLMEQKRQLQTQTKSERIHQKDQ